MNLRTLKTALAVPVVAGVLAVTGCASSSQAHSAATLPPAPTAGPISGSTTRHPPSTARAYVGLRWKLSSVRHGGHEVGVPASYAATVEFAPAGTILMSDSVNSLFGHYATTPTGFTTSAMGTTLVAYGGSDPSRTLVIAAVGAIAYGPMTNGTFAPSAAVEAHVIADKLVITAAGYQLTFDRAGIATDPAPAVPTPSAVS